MLDHRQATEWKPWQGRHGPDARAARNWRNPVPEADWTMQFVCVEEFRETDGFARRMGSRDILVAARVVDAQVLRVFVQAFPSEGEEGFEVHVTWSDDSPCGVSRRRPFAFARSRTQDLKCIFAAGLWRLLLRFAIDFATGQACSVGLAASKNAEGRCFAEIFSSHAWRNFCKSYIHRCMPTFFY